MRAWLSAVLAVSCLTAAASAGAQGTAASADSLRTLANLSRSFDVIARDSYLRRHAFSLDHFLEFEPGGLVTRLGPIGNEAFYSRWGIGRGRARVLVNGVPMNDPQDGVAPLVHIATSGLATLSLDTPAEQSFASGVEGAVALRDLVAPTAKPNTFIELSKGTNALRQRRVRFGSEAGRVGLDLSYDEVLDDGYDFDANNAIPPELGPPPEGRTVSRNAAIAVRGDMSESTHYSIGLRRFQSSSTGDLQSAANESSRSGHLAWATVGLGTTEATVYGRGYRTTRPDSSISNESVGGVVAWNLYRGGATFHMFGLGEHTNALQNMGAGEAHNQVSTVDLGASTELSRGRLTWFASGALGGDEQSTAWGAGGGVRTGVARGDVTLSARRSFRLPSIGERYLPAHTHDGVVLSGNAGLDAESAWEANAAWTLRTGGVTNRVQASWMRSIDYVSLEPVEGDSTARRPENAGDKPAMTFLEERVGVATHVGAVEVSGNAGALFSSGDRTGAFMSVPRTQVNASLTCGMQLFEKSSALYLSGEYAFVDDRRDYNGVPLSSFNVINISLIGRLIDARFYVRWLNMLDESYQTVSGYLMTPRTLAYGIEWTLFD